MTKAVLKAAPPNTLLAASPDAPGDVAGALRGLADIIDAHAATAYPVNVEAVTGVFFHRDPATGDIVVALLRDG